MAEADRYSPAALKGSPPGPQSCSGCESPRFPHVSAVTRCDAATFVDAACVRGVPSPQRGHCGKSGAACPTGGTDGPGLVPRGLLGPSGAG
eukprot:1191916-Prorocentrum_minimum.AAC.2